MSSNESRRPTAVGMHIFAGGFTVGVREAGFEVACHLEVSPYGVSTAESNLGLPVFWPKERWPMDALEEAEVDFLYANPPCAVFSNMGVTHDAGPGSQAWRGDPRTSCWWDVLKAAERVQPRVWAIESVTQAYGTGRPLVDEFTRRSVAGGWSVTHLFVDSRWHGIPQGRRRFLFVAHRPGELDLEPTSFAPPPTVGEVLSRVPEPGPYSAPPGLLKYAAATPPGGSVSETYDEAHAAVPGGPPRNALGKRAGRPSFQDRRLDPGGISFVVAGDKLWHPSGERRLGTEELKAICGFPAWFNPQGPQNGHASLLARGLMPPVAAWVGRTAARTLLRPDDLASRRVRVADLRKPGIPAADITAEYGAGGPRARPDPGLEPPEQPAASPKRPGSRPQRQQPAPAQRPGPLLAGEAPPSPGEGSGRYMQRLLLAGVPGDECVRRVHQHFAGRTTKRGDAYYNYRKLAESGLYPELPPWRAQ